jgi:hypothetical protein
MIARVTDARYLHGYVLELRFADGSRGRVDFRPWIVGRGGLFTALEDIETFKKVQVDIDAGTVVWPNGLDFCPDVLLHHATGAPLPGEEPHRPSPDLRQ